MVVNYSQFKYFKNLKENGVWLEITNLIVPTYTDDLNMIENMVKWLIDNGFADVPLHFLDSFLHINYLIYHLHL